MGIPQTYLQFLWPLGDRESSGEERTAITEALSDFELFCFVLIDPARDLNLHARLVSEWEHFDRYSGRHMLFFAPIDPPTAWRDSDRVHERPLHRAWRGMHQAGDRLSIERGFAPILSQDPSRSANALRLMLGVPTSVGACLVVTRALTASSGWLLATNGQSIDAQLERLGSLASAMRQDPPTDFEIDVQIARIASSGGCLAQRIECGRPIAAPLAEVCQSAVPDLPGWMRIRAYRMSQALATPDEEDRWISLQKAAASLLLHQRTSPSDDQASHGMGAPRSGQDDRLFSCRSMTDASRKRITPRDRPGRLTSEAARNLFEYGDELFDLIAERRIGASRDWDARPAIVLWAQALEHEFAEVLGHEVRADLGIMLPAFFWRHQPDRPSAAVRIAGRAHPISFNMPPRHWSDPMAAPWNPPALGEMRLAWQEWRNGTGRRCDESLVTALTESNHARNRAAHPTEPISLADAQSARECILQSLLAIENEPATRWRHTLEDT
jgi:hypothetical protein